MKVNIIMHNNGKEVVEISIENPLKMLRESLLISRSELARKASVSFLTVRRIEEGKPCRLDTKRKIVKALGMNPWLEIEITSSPEP
jgi:DNA-binding XRE family transcriptional regulator